MLQNCGLEITSRILFSIASGILSSAYDDLRDHSSWRSCNGRREQGGTLRLVAFVVALLVGFLSVVVSVQQQAGQLALLGERDNFQQRTADKVAIGHFQLLFQYFHCIGSINVEAFKGIRQSSVRDVRGSRQAAEFVIESRLFDLAPYQVDDFLLGRTGSARFFVIVLWYKIKVLEELVRKGHGGWRMNKPAEAAKYS